MENINIGLIGAQGHMGKAVGRRIRELQKRGLLSNWNLLESTSHDNRELASLTDLLLLTVRPGQVETALQGVEGHVSKDAGLLSLAGVVPLEFLRARFGGSVSRAMADLNFEQALHCGLDERSQLLMQALSEDECLETADELALDQHTTLVACNPGISAWQFLNNAESADAWLRAHNELTHSMLGVSRSAMERLQRRVHSGGNFAQKINEVATAGGVTESMVKALEASAGDISICELFDVGMGRIAQVREKFHSA